MEKVRESIPTEQLEAMTRGLSFADALRAGVKTTDQEYNWGSGYKACALSTVRLGGEATGWIK